MAPETYYHFFSLIATTGALLYLINLAQLRLAGKTTFGLEFKPGTVEYKRVVRLASNRNIVVISILALIFVGNVVNSTARVMSLGTSDARFILIFAPVSTVLAFALMIYWVRQQIHNSRFGKRG